MLLVIALSLQAAATPAPALARKPVVRRSATIRAPRGANKAPLRITLGQCALTHEACGTSPTRDFRLGGGQPTLGYDAKRSALSNLEQAPCETRGMPVCPSQGRQIFSALIE